MNSRGAAVLAALLAPGSAGTARAQVVPQASGIPVEIRGLHAADARTAWAGGREGWFARTSDGGLQWHADTVPGASRLFFVDAHAAHADTAWLLGQSFDGGLARIYRTTDGGASWLVQFESTHPDIFLDGIAFWNARRGIAFGDPIGGAFTVYRTDDGGSTWSRVPPARLPPSLAGEAAFAASGTAVAVWGRRHAWIATGGAAVARVLRTTDGGVSWTASETPLPGGRTAGLFGIAFRDSLHGVAVGGDYTRPDAADPNVLVTTDGGRTWTLTGASAPAGVRWGLAWDAAGRRWIAVGPSGVGVSPDGRRWTALEAPGFNTVTAAGGAAWVAGRDGAVAVVR